MTNRHDDPYKKVWNSVEDEESDLLNAVKNGTLFEPTRAELARRHMSTARYLLKRARTLGRTVEGRMVFEEAVSHRNIAEKMLKSHYEMLRKAKPQYFSFTVIEEAAAKAA